MRGRLVAIGLLAVVLVPPTATAQTTRITPDQFAGRLREAQRLASDGADAPSPAALVRIRAGLGLPVVVVFAEGDALRVDMDPFLAALSGRDARDFNRAAAHLEALRAGLERATRSPPADRARVREAVRDAYRGVRASPSLRERILRAVTEWFGSVVDRLSNFSGAGSAIAWAIVAVVLGLALWLLTRLRLVPERALRARRAPPREEIDWHRLAREALRRGDEPEAVRAHYRALLAALAARGVVPDTPSLTAGECRTSVGRLLPGAYADVAGATRIFERVAYGRQALLPGEIEAMRRAEQVAKAA